MKLLRVGGMAILLVAAIVLGKAWLMPGATSLAGQSSAVGTEHPENEAIRARLAKQNEMLERMAQFEHAAMSASSRRAASQDGDGPGGHDRAAENTSRLTPEQLREQMSAQRAEAREQGVKQFASLGSGWAGQPVTPVGPIATKRTSGLRWLHPNLNPSH